MKIPARDLIVSVLPSFDYGATRMRLTHIPTNITVDESTYGLRPDQLRSKLERELVREIQHLAYETCFGEVA